METKDFIFSEKVSGEGDDALYNLYIYGKLAAAAISWDEVIQHIEKAYKDEENKDVMKCGQ